MHKPLTVDELVNSTCLKGSHLNSYFLSLAPMEKEDCNMFFEGDDCKKGELLLVRFAKDSRVKFHSLSFLPYRSDPNCSKGG